MTDHYSKLTPAILVPRKIASHVAMTVLKSWIGPHFIPNTVMTDNGLQLVTKFFSTLYAPMGPKLVGTTEYRPQANDPEETVS